MPEVTESVYQTGILNMRSIVGNGKMAKNRTVTGISGASVTDTVGIQDNVLIDPAGPDATILVNVNKIFKYQYIKFSEKRII